MCIGAGIGALATAIATIDSDGDVIIVASDAPLDVAAGVTPAERAVRGWWRCDATDDATVEYFSALSEGLVPEIRDLPEVGLAVRVARDLPIDGSSPLPTFFGARLPEWTAQCVASPYGVFSSKVFGELATPMQSADGETIEVLSVGSIDWSDGLGEKALFEWMAEQARDRDIEIRDHGQLQRMIFEDGAVVGVEFSTPDGPYSVRTRYGLTLSPTEPKVPRNNAGTVTVAADRMQVCLVATAGSRFARVELVATPSDKPVRRPVCLSSGRQLPEDMRHSSSKPPSDASRCGKVEGYQPRGK